MNAEEFFKQKKALKKQSRRGQAVEEAGMGLTSLMDIVSIIVIYLLKSYASDPVLITPIADQKIPMSRVDSPIQEGTPVYLSTRAIIVLEKKVQVLEDGKTPADVSGQLIGPLYDVLAEEADKAKQMAENRKTAWDARLILGGDSALPFETLVKVMFTAGKAEFTEYAFCVIRQG